MGMELRGGGNAADLQLDLSEHWLWLGQALQAGDYEHIVNWLSAFAGMPDVGAANRTMIATAVQLCHLCQQHQQETEAIWDVYQQSVTRAIVLSEMLDDLLRLILAQDEARDPPAEKVEQPASVPKTLSFWERIQQALGLVLPPERLVVQPIVYTASDQIAVQPDETLANLAVDQSGAEKRPYLAVYALGAFRVYVHRQLVENWKGHKSKAILAYLLFHPGLIHRDVLTDVFWRDIEPETARRNLYQTIYVLRQALDSELENESVILCENSAYQINPQVSVWSDYEAFRDHYERGRQLANKHELEMAVTQFQIAESLYKGEFVADDRYEEWLQILREDLHYLYLDVIDRLSRYYHDQGQYGIAIAYAQKILQYDACREDAHRRLMRAYYHLGQRPMAMRQYHLCAEALKNDLDVEPMPATSQLYQQIQVNNLKFPPAKI
jgi:DNA-binding SARP family transcriptional activator